VGDFETPVFVAGAGTPVRFRVLNPGGVNDQIFEIAGHNWQEEPYTANSTEIGDNPLSQWQGARMGHGPRNHFDAVIKSAGGTEKVPGDYLYRTHTALGFRSGMWGVFRVSEAGKDAITMTTVYGSAGANRTIFGFNSVDPGPGAFTGQMATSVEVFNGTPSGSGCGGTKIGTVTPDKTTGAWKITTTAQNVCAVSNLGGVGTLDLTQPFPTPCVTTNAVPKATTTTTKAPNVAQPTAQAVKAAADVEDQKIDRLTKVDKAKAKEK
jgi:hypothetical protein